jgi:hypothetical protein
MRSALLLLFCSSCALHDGLFWYTHITSTQGCDLMIERRAESAACRNETPRDDCVYPDAFDERCMFSGENRNRCPTEYQAWLECILTPDPECTTLGEQSELCADLRAAYVGCAGEGTCGNVGGDGEGE